MNDFTIRFAGPEDGDALAAMIDATDRCYRDPERPAGEARAAAEAWLRDGASDSRFVLGFAGPAPVGFASFAVLHPGRALRGLLFLKDVFVVTGRRGQGIGEPMMQFLAGFCARQGVGHIDWIVETARAALLRAPRSDRPAAKSAS